MMPRPKPINYNLPGDWSSRLLNKTIVTKGDKLALLRALQHRAGTSLLIGTDRVTFAAIIADIRASSRPQRDSAPADTRAPSNPKQNSEASASIPASVLERKIDTPHGALLIRINVDTSRLIITHESICALSLTSSQADQLAEALTELADDLRQDVAARAWSQNLLEATTE